MLKDVTVLTQPVHEGHKMQAVILEQSVGFEPVDKKLRELSFGGIAHLAQDEARDTSISVQIVKRKPVETHLKLVPRNRDLAYYASICAVSRTFSQ